MHDVLEDDLVGMYLHGSAVLGGGGPRSDVDVLAVAKRPTTGDERQLLLELCRSVSLSPRPLEFDLVVATEIRPWRHPAPYDFHYSELRRDGSGPGTNRDLASVVTMVLAGNRTLYGPSPADLLDPVPRTDYMDAILKDTETVDEYLAWDTRNVILTLARVWAGVGSDVVHSKKSAAEWALARLPEELRLVLERAVATYRGEREDFWDDVQPQIAEYADYVQNAIKMAST